MASFRPLTGTAFLKSEELKRKGGLDVVSVPSRGLHFSNQGGQRNEKNYWLFPSPHGDCISQIRNKITAKRKEFSFRPLTGTAFLKYFWFVVVNGFQFTASFRPLTGTAFLKLLRRLHTTITGTRFPSPHGDCISQMSFVDFMELLSQFPSPHGDCISQISL